MKNILIVMLGAFGDILATTGAIKAIRLTHSSDHLTVLTTSPYRRLFSDCPWIDEVMIDPRKPRVNLLSLYKLFRSINAKQFDLVYDLKANGRTRLYRRFVRAPWHYGWDEIRESLADNGLDIQQMIEPDVSWLVEDPTEFLTLRHISPNYIFLIPGCSARHPQKRWPHYAELAEKLMQKGYEVIVAPGPDEIELCKSFPCPVLFKDEKPVSMKLLAGLLEKARFVIGNDTGPTHLAAYLGIPGLALFGSHASAASTGLNRFFDVFEVKSLNRLPVEIVLARVLARLENN